MEDYERGKKLDREDEILDILGITKDQQIEQSEENARLKNVTSESKPPECIFCGKYPWDKRDFIVEMSFSPNKITFIKCYYCVAELPSSKELPQICPQCKMRNPLGVQAKEHELFSTEAKRYYSLYFPICKDCSCEKDRKFMLRIVIGGITGFIIGIAIVIWAFVKGGGWTFDVLNPMDSIFELIMVVVGWPIITTFAGLIIPLTYMDIKRKDEVKQIQQIKRLMDVGWKTKGNTFF